MKPIYLVTYGRSGSTLFLSLMSKHPKILTRSIFPFETRASQYYFIFEKKRIPITKLFKKIVGFQEKIEYIPFQANDKDAKIWAKTIQVNETNNIYNKLTNHFYDHIAKIENKQNASYFIEKVIGLNTVKEIYKSSKNNVKLIFLKRDPRDMFFSIKAFNKKRGYLSFGENLGDYQMFYNIINYYIESQKILSEYSRESLSIKYEDLIKNTNYILKNVFDSLHIDSNDILTNRIISEILKYDTKTSNHMTQAVDKTISRWLEESTPEHLKLFEKYNTKLAHIGYH